MSRGRRAVIAVLVAAIGISTAAPAGVGAQAPIQTAPIVIEGVAHRQVLDASAPLYITSTVTDEKARWMRDAMEIALAEVPRITGLPLPPGRIEFYLFSDPRELARQTGQILRSPGPRVAPECFALASVSTPRRGIYCQAEGWGSAAEALDFVAHELTHQVQQGDETQRRAIAQWYNEGLSEYVQARVLADHGPAYGARDWWAREARVASALHNGRLRRLRDLSTNQRWQQEAGAGWAGLIYSQSSLVVGWLAETYGLDRVVEVVRRTGGPFAFDQAFQDVFGMSVDRAESAAVEALTADLLPRYPVGLSFFQFGGARDGQLHVATVGFRPRESLQKEYRYEDGLLAAAGEATGSRPEAERTDATGFASWTWRGTPGSIPQTGRALNVTVRGSDGSEASEWTVVEPGS
jgi:hypothetical protein